MNRPTTPTTPAPQDESICFEAHGLLDQSYDSLNALLLGLTHAEAATVPASPAPAEHAGGAEVTIVGQAGALLPAHLFL